MVIVVSQDVEIALMIDSTFSKLSKHLPLTEDGSILLRTHDGTLVEFWDTGEIGIVKKDGELIDIKEHEYS